MRCSPAFNKSHLKNVLDSTNIVEVVRQQWPHWQQLLNQGKPGLHDAETEHALAIAIHHPMCVFIDAVDVSGQPMPQPRFGVLIDGR